MGKRAHARMVCIFMIYGDCNSDTYRGLMYAVQNNSIESRGFVLDLYRAKNVLPFLE